MDVSGSRSRCGDAAVGFTQVDNCVFDVADRGLDDKNH